MLTGPNMAGKSTHLTMVGTLTLLAHVGSHVPATACAVPLRRCVVLRASTAGIGGLFCEAGQLAAALEAADDRALVLLDEVGYATGTADGLALGWAVAETLLERGALSMLATHLLELRRVAQVYATATHTALEVCGRFTKAMRVNPGELHRWRWMRVVWHAPGALQRLGRHRITGWHWHVIWRCQRMCWLRLPGWWHCWGTHRRRLNTLPPRGLLRCVQRPCGWHTRCGFSFVCCTIATVDALEVGGVRAGEQASRAGDAGSAAEPSAPCACNTSQQRPSWALIAVKIVAYAEQSMSSPPVAKRARLELDDIDAQNNVFDQAEQLQAELEQVYTCYGMTCVAVSA